MGGKVTKLPSPLFGRLISELNGTFLSLFGSFIVKEVNRTIILFTNYSFLFPYCTPIFFPAPGGDKESVFEGKRKEVVHSSFPFLYVFLLKTREPILLPSFPFQYPAYLSFKRSVKPGKFYLERLLEYLQYIVEGENDE